MAYTPQNFMAQVKHHLQKVGGHLKDHFIPHQGNGYRPHVLKHSVLVGYSVVLVLLKVLVIVVPLVLPSSSLYSSAITRQNIIDLTNQTRANLSLGVLKENTKLDQSAQAKANDMLQQQYFAHVSPNGASPWSWFAAAGYRYTYAGENLAVHFTSAEDVQEGWLASPTHRANIVQPNYTEMGVGVAMGTFEGFDSIFVVEHFGAPVVLATATPPAPHLTPSTTSAPVTKTVVPAPAPATPGTVAAAEATPKPKPVPPPAATTPAPVPAPAAAAPAATAPVVYDASLKLTPVGAAYQLSVLVTGAESVTARLASQSVPLIPDPLSATWSGTLPFNAAEFSKSGEMLSVTAVGRDGLVTDRPLVLLAPAATTQHLYTFNEGTDRFAKFFGFLTVHNLGDSVTQFYLYFVVFLTAALLLNIFIKIRVQHVSVISHAGLVLALALVLTVV